MWTVIALFRIIAIMGYAMMDINGNVDMGRGCPCEAGAVWRPRRARRSPRVFKLTRKTGRLFAVSNANSSRTLVNGSFG